MDTDLTPLTGKIKSRPFLALDIESKADDTQDAGFTRPFMCGVYDGEKYYSFYDDDQSADPRDRYWLPGGCVDKMMRFLLRKKYRNHHIYAHNAGKFDYLFLTPWLMQIGTSMGFRFNIIPVASGIQVMDVWKKAKGDVSRFKHKHRFLDSLRLIPMS